MPRVKVPVKIQSLVLFKAGHVCSICQKDGMGVNVHHMDGNNSNNKESNLIVVCSQHHDEVERRSPLSKGYSIVELKKYKQDWEKRVKNRRKSLEFPEKIRLIRFDGGNTDVVFMEESAGYLRAFKDALTFELFGFNWGNIDIYPENPYKGEFIIGSPLANASDCRKVRLRFSNGTQANEVYIIWEDGKKHHIPDPETLREIGGKEAELVNYDEFNSIPHGQPVQDIFSIRLRLIMKESMDKDQAERGK